MKSTKKKTHMRKTKRRIKHRKTGKNVKNVQRRQRTIKYGGKYSDLGDSSPTSSHALFNKDWENREGNDSDDGSWVVPVELSPLVADTYVDEERRIENEETKEFKLFTKYKKSLTKEEMVALFTIYLLTKDILKDNRYFVDNASWGLMNTKLSQSIMSSGSRYTKWIELYKNNKPLPKETSSVIDWFETMILGGSNAKDGHVTIIGSPTIGSPTIGRQLYDKIKEGFDEKNISDARRRLPRNPVDDIQAALVEAGFQRPN